MTEKLDSEQSRRLWEFRLHLETQLYNRLTFFLIFESVLLGVVGALYSKTSQSILVLRAIVFLGFCITVVWLYIQHNSKQSFVVMENRAKVNFPEHNESINRLIFSTLNRDRIPCQLASRLLLCKESKHFLFECPLGKNGGKSESSSG